MTVTLYIGKIPSQMPERVIGLPYYLDSIEFIITSAWVEGDKLLAVVNTNSHLVPRELGG